jgi:hypothetical protein
MLKKKNQQRKQLIKAAFVYYSINKKIKVMITQEKFERMDGLSLTKEINILNNIIMKISEDLYYSEQFSKEDIIGFLQKVVELEVESVLDGVED